MGGSAEAAGSGQQGQRRTPSRVWKLDDQENLKVVFVRTGITDNSYTEILGDSLKEGDEIIIGILTVSSRASSGSSGRPGPPGPVMIRR
jgi:multidrug efflux pump subunit AcrA (membrane-fusion protein)